MIDALKRLFLTRYEDTVELELKAAKINLLHAQAQKESADAYAVMMQARVNRLHQLVNQQRAFLEKSEV